MSRGILFLSGLIICGLGLFSDVEAAKAKVDKQPPPNFAALEKAIAAIFADTNPPKLQTAAEFMAKNK